MKRCGKLLLMLIGIMSLASCEKYTISEINEFRNIPVEYLFIVSCDVPNQVYNVFFYRVWTMN